MASVIMRYSGKLDDQEIQLVCSEEKLVVTVTHSSKLFFWKGEMSTETLKETQPRLPSATELFDALVEALSGQSRHPSSVKVLPEEHKILCSFTFVRRAIEVLIPVKRQQHSLERMQEHLFNQMSPFVLKVDSLERDQKEHVLMQTELISTKMEEFKTQLKYDNEELSAQLKQQQHSICNLNLILEMLASENHKSYKVLVYRKYKLKYTMIARKSLNI